MSQFSADTNLLVGFLALQLNFITRDQFFAAMNTWIADKSQLLADVLLRQNSLTPDIRQLLDALVEKHIGLHNGDPAQSLAAISSLTQIRRQLAAVADEDVQQSLAQVASLREQAGGSFGEDDPNRTEPFRQSTSDCTRFRILRPHARGGLGEVFIAEDSELRREVALKQIQQGQADNADSRSRFLLEAEITGGLEHPGIVPVYGLGQYADGRPFYAMRFIRGDSLQDAIRHFHKPIDGKPNDRLRLKEVDRMLEFRKLLGRFVDVCQAIAYAHSRGVLHRDLKPGNIMLGKYGETLVVDWGLAKAIANNHLSSNELNAEQPLKPTSNTGSAPTAMGSAIGTPAYMSPEQAAGRLDLLGPASDVYSLGATLYSILTGCAPQTSKDFGEVLANVCKGEFPKPRTVKKDIPRSVEAICLKAMSINAAARYESCQSVAADIQRYLADEATRASLDSWPDRVGRWTRKNKGWVYSLAVAMLFTTVVSTVAAVKVYDQRNKANNAAAVALLDRAFAIRAAGTTGCRARFLESVREASPLIGSTIDRDRVLAETIACLADPNALAPLTKAEAESEQSDRCSADLTSSPDIQSFTDQFGSFQYRFQGTQVYCANKNGISNFTSHLGSVHCMTADRTGEFIAVGCEEGVIVWNCIKQSQSAFFRSGTIFQVALNDSHGLLATISANDKLELWSIWSNRLRAEYPLPSTHSRLAFNVGGDKLLLCAAKGSEPYAGWNVVNTPEKMSLAGHRGGVTALSFRSDAKQLASCSKDGSVALWNVVDGTLERRMEAPRKDIQAVAYTPDGSLVVSADWYGNIVVWNTTKDPNSDHIKTFTVGSQIWDIGFSPDSKSLFAITANELRRWSVTVEGESINLVAQASQSIRDGVDLSISNNSQLVAVTARDGLLTLIDFENPAVERTIVEGVRPMIYSNAFSHDGKHLCYIAENGGTIETRSVGLTASSQPTAPIKVTSASALCIATNQAVAAVGSFYQVRLVSLTTGDIIFTTPYLDSPVWSVALSPDGEHLAIGSADGTIQSWNVRQTVASLAGVGLVQSLAPPSITADLDVPDRKFEEIDRVDFSLATAEDSGSRFSNDHNSNSDDRSIEFSDYEIWWRYAGAVKGWRFLDQALINEPKGIIAEDFQWLDDGKKLALLARGKWTELSEHGRSPVMDLNSYLLAVTNDGRRYATVFIPFGKTKCEISVGSRASEESIELGEGGDPKWSNDGAELVYFSEADGPRLVIWDGETSTELKPRFHWSITTFPAFAPDGRSVFAALQADDGTRQIYQLSCDGAYSRQITARGEFNSYPSISPDGEHLAFVRTEPMTGRNDLHIMHVSSRREVLAVENVDAVRPGWRPASNK